jgi:DNA polymerase
MKLPSGRNLTYLYPKLKPTIVILDEIDPKTGRKKRFNTTQIDFYGPIPGRVGVYGTISTYGGKLVENATQATAYDLMAFGGCNADEHGYLICMLVHDEALEEKLEGQTTEEFCELLAMLPKWARGLPLKAEGEEIPYYKKT